MIKVYIKTDDENRVTAISSAAFISDTEGWTLIDEGEGDRFTHAQNGYLAKPLVTEGGAYQYEFVDGVPVERAQEDVAADEVILAALPAPMSAEERIAELEEALDMLLSGVTE